MRPASAFRRCARFSPAAISKSFGRTRRRTSGPFRPAPSASPWAWPGPPRATSSWARPSDRRGRATPRSSVVDPATLEPGTARVFTLGDVATYGDLAVRGYAYFAVQRASATTVFRVDADTLTYPNDYWPLSVDGAPALLSLGIEVDNDERPILLTENDHSGLRQLTVERWNADDGEVDSSFSGDGSVGPLVLSPVGSAEPPTRIVRGPPHGRRPGSRSWSAGAGAPSPRPASG